MHYLIFNLNLYDFKMKNSVISWFFFLNLRHQLVLQLSFVLQKFSFDKIRAPDYWRGLVSATVSYSSEHNYMAVLIIIKILLVNNIYKFRIKMNTLNVQIKRCSRNFYINISGWKLLESDSVLCVLVSWRRDPPKIFTKIIRVLFLFVRFKLFTFILRFFIVYKYLC